MRKFYSFVLLVLLLLSNALPALAAETGSRPQPEKPYEKVVAKNGSWYAEHLDFGNGSELVVAYEGEYKADSLTSGDNPADMQFTVGEKIILKGICLPYANRLKEPVAVKLEDERGNLYGPFKTVETFANTVAEMSIAGRNNKARNDLLDGLAESVNYVYAPDQEIILPAGKYTMIVSESQGQVRNKETGGKGAFLLRGVNYSANERYKEKMKQWEEENLPNHNPGEAKKLGSEEFAGKEPDKYVFEKAKMHPEKKPIVFTLESESLVEEIIVNTFNDGKGAAPGIITILDEKGHEVAAYQSVGGTLGKVVNGVWAVIPNMVLPQGNYTVSVSDPQVVAYDKSGNPQFYVTISPPPAARYDFTGTYQIDLETRKTSTLMGPVQGDGKSFSLKDFELTILDKNGEIEFIGKYEGMPFSQGCRIIEESRDKVVVEFDFSADLSKLPYKAKVGARATLTLIKPKKGKPEIEITGTGTYQREETAEKGADFNTYSIKAKGIMKDKSLPPFVAAVLGKPGGAGNIPGPGSPMQAAAGLLFPPLAGVVAYVLQEMLKPKPKAPRVKKYSPAWYAQQYPGKTQEQLAWIMLADAMANTDEPDEEDAESVGDNEKPGGEDYTGSEGGTQDGAEDNTWQDDGMEAGNDEAGTGGAGSDADGAAIETGSADTEAGGGGAVSEGKGNGESAGAADNDITSNGEGNKDGGRPDAAGESKENAAESKADSAEKQEQEAKQPELETLTLQVDHTGRTATYVKDLATGEWVNPETGGVLDLERYNKVVAPNFAKDKAFIDEQREKLEKGDTAFDREIRKAAKEAEAKEAYMDKLAKKYGTRDKDELEKIIREQQQKEQQSAEAWKRAGDRYDYAEKGAKVAGVLADAGVDALANMTGPAGKGIRAGYKVLKGVAGSMAEDGVSASSFASGAVKGGADACTDFIDNPYKKAVVTVGGEVIGGAIGNGTKGAKDGLVDGISKVVTGTITDKIGGNGYGNEMSSMVLKNGNVRVAVKSGDKWIGKTLTEASANSFVNKKLMNQGLQSGVKTAGGLLDEFGIKPYVTEPLKKKL